MYMIVSNMCCNSESINFHIEIIYRFSRANDKEICILHNIVCYLILWCGNRSEIYMYIFTHKYILYILYTTYSILTAQQKKKNKTL